jgi:predicted  nucleic acid-binding Zn-ribbon protein
VDFSPADVGAALGGAAASFLATYVALVRPLAGKIKKNASAPEDIQAIRALLEELKAELGKALTRIERMERDAERAAQAIDKVEEKQGRTVSQEEFATYAQSMQQSLQGLVEKLGHATGTIEAWVRQQPGGR